MSILQNKIDFAAVVSCKNANPNGDPLNGNMPRKTYAGFGEISDVCIKRKLRNRLMDMGENIFVQSDDKRADQYKSLRERAESNSELKDAGKDKDKFAQAACRSWIDVRSFGQVFAFKGDKSDGVSVGIRGPVSVQSAFSADTIDITSMQITKSVNNEKNAKGDDKKSADTMGMKHRVDFGAYIIKGSINVQLAEKTGFTEEDAQKIKEALRTLFVNDSSSARPDGTMTVEKLVWWKHNNKIGQYPASKVHNLLRVELKDADKSPLDISDYNITVDKFEDLSYEEYEGL